MRLTEEEYTKYMSEKRAKGVKIRRVKIDNSNKLRKLYKKNGVKIKRVQYEKKDHVAFMNMVREQLPKVVPFVYKIEHGGWKPPQEAKFLNEAGLQGGIFDYFIAIPKFDQIKLVEFLTETAIYSHDNKKIKIDIPCYYNGFWIEFKHGKKKLSEDQIKFKKIQESQGYKCEVAYSPEDGIKILKEYLER